MKKHTTITISYNDRVSAYTAPADTDTSVAIASAIGRAGIKNASECYVEIDTIDEHGDFVNHDEGYGSIKNGTFIAEI